jgi:hypothetical protein
MMMMVEDEREWEMMIMDMMMEIIIMAKMGRDHYYNYYYGNFN